MLFNSPIFMFVFAPVTLLIIGLARHHSSRSFTLSIAVVSFVFYGWFDQTLLAFMIASIAFNFLAAFYVSRKPIFIAAIVANLLPLLLFKYLDVLGSAWSIASGREWEALNLAIPLGISFYALHQIGYLVDVRNSMTPVRSDPAEYAAFVAFFPQLIAGPIVRANQFFPQLAEPIIERWHGLTLGLTWFAIGLFKKVVLADSIAPLADKLFEEAATKGLNAFEAWAAAFAFGLQLYFDFAGYSTMAVGLALMCGIALPYNFDTPYRSRSPREFWRRWHITLSQFLRDRVFVPLGGSRQGVVRTSAALMITMVLGGLWHGAGAQFAVWGAYHGLLLVIAHLTGWGGKSHSQALSFRGLVSWAMTLVAIMLGWLFFRAPSLSIAWEMVQSALTVFDLRQWASIGVGSPDVVAEYWLIPVMLTLALALPDIPRLIGLSPQSFRPTPLNLALTCGLFAVSMSFLTAYSPFLYFQF